MKDKYRVWKNGETPEGAKYFLEDIEIFEVSLVSKPAVPDALFQIRKSADSEANIDRVDGTFRICKVDKVKKQVFGYALVPDVADYYDDAVTVEELEKAAHSFPKNLAHGTSDGTGTGQEHLIFAGVGWPIESAIDRKGALGKAHGFAKTIENAWFIGVQVANDDTWEKIENGELTGFSIGGLAKRVEIENSIHNDPLEHHEKGEISLGDRIANLLKGDSTKAAESVDEIIVDIDFYDEAWKLFSALRASMYSIYEDEELSTDAKKSKVTESCNQFQKAFIEIMVAAIQTGEVTNSVMRKKLAEAIDALADIKKINILQDSLTTRGEIQMTQDEMKNLIKSETEELSTKVAGLEEKFNGFDAKIDKLLEANKSDDGDDGTSGDDKTEKKVDETATAIEALKVVVESVVEKVDKIAKTPGERRSEGATKSDRAPDVKARVHKDIPRDPVTKKILWSEINKGIAFGDPPGVQKDADDESGETQESADNPDGDKTEGNEE